MIDAGPELSVLIVNYNSTELLRRCLASLAASTIADRLEVIVVDNASEDFDEAALAAEFPWAKLLPQSTNTTWTGGNNIAFAESSAPVVLLLNPDTEVEPEALERAVGHLRADPSLVGLGAYLIGPDGNLQRYYRRLPTLLDLPVILFEPIFRHTRRGRRYLMLDEPFDRPTPVQQPPGAFLMCRRSAVGPQLLDPGYFNFVSDVELCDRLSTKGALMVFPDVRTRHIRAGAGVGTTNAGVRLLLIHDLGYGIRRYMRKHASPAARCATTPIIILYWISRITRLALRRPGLWGASWSQFAEAIGGKPPVYDL